MKADLAQAKSALRRLAMDSLFRTLSFAMRVELWAHLVSEHAMFISPSTSLSDLIGSHKHEHDGPGTIRNHDPESRHFDLKKIGKVLSEWYSL